MQRTCRYASAAQNGGVTQTYPFYPPNKVVRTWQTFLGAGAYDSRAVT